MPETQKKIAIQFLSKDMNDKTKINYGNRTTYEKRSGNFQATVVN